MVTQVEQWCIHMIFGIECSTIYFSCTLQCKSIVPYALNVILGNIIYCKMLRILRNSVMVTIIRHDISWSAGSLV